MENSTVILVGQQKIVINQTNNDASVGCLPIKASGCDPTKSGNAVDGLHEPIDVQKIHFPGIESEKLLNKEAALLNLVNPRPAFQQEYYSRQNFYPSVPKMWPNRVTFDHIYPMNRDLPFCADSRIHYQPLNKMLYQGYTPELLQCQEFQYFVVIDFEATCDKEINPHPQEIIEFPSVLVNGNSGQLEASFQTYVRPTHHQHLSDFCKDLTGVQQSQVDRGVTLSEALFMHDRWLEDKGVKQTNFAVVTWGDWDCQIMLQSECRFKKIMKPPYFDRWANLKIPFQKTFGGVKCNLEDAIRIAGLSFEGRPHCGLDDARNTAQLVTLLMDHGCRISITNALTFQDCAEVNPPFISRGTIDPSTLQQKLQELPRGRIQHYPYAHFTGREWLPYCFCGVVSSKCLVRKPGPTQGRCFFGCGKWTTTKGAVCTFVAWAPPQAPAMAPPLMKRSFGTSRLSAQV